MTTSLEQAGVAAQPSGAEPWAPPAPAAALLPARLRLRIEALLEGGGRRLLGLAGPPGAGKSTLAAAIARALPGVAQVVPMDGFHLANDELERLARRHRKGAPDTFDAAGYVALLARLRGQRPDEIVYAPEFRRELDEPVANAIAVDPATRLVVTEGNYLLLDGPWAAVAGLVDEIWYVEADDELRRARLAARHERFGRAPEDARAWVAVTDEPNARLVAATRRHAMQVVRWDAG